MCSVFPLVLWTYEIQFNNYFNPCVIILFFFSGDKLGQIVGLFSFVCHIWNIAVLLPDVHCLKNCFIYFFQFFSCVRWGGKYDPCYSILIENESSVSLFYPNTETYTYTRVPTFMRIRITCVFARGYILSLGFQYISLIKWICTCVCSYSYMNRHTHVICWLGTN